MAAADVFSEGLERRADTRKKEECMTQIVAGRVNKDGSIAAGSGFYVRALGGGIYIVEFEQPLPGVPTVVLKENYREWQDTDYDNGNTFDNVVLVAVDQKGFEIVTGNGRAEKVDRNFAFIAALPSAQTALPAIVWGQVGAGADVISGTGYEATGIGDGKYLLDFDAAFDELWSVVLTQNNPSITPVPSTLDNAVIVAAKGSQVKYITGDSNGARQDRNCSFVAVGKRPGSDAPPRLTFGNVNADGTTTDGHGSGDFTVRKSGAGTYVITFVNAFTSPPAVLATQNYPLWTDFKGPAGSPLDNALVVAIDKTQATIVTGGASGEAGDRNFGFLAAG